MKLYGLNFPFKSTSVPIYILSYKRSRLYTLSHHNHNHMDRASHRGAYTYLHKGGAAHCPPTPSLTAASPQLKLVPTLKDGCHQFGAELLHALVVWEDELIEASVGLHEQNQE